MSLPFSTTFVGANGTVLPTFNPVFENVQGTAQIQSNAAAATLGQPTVGIAVADAGWLANQYAQIVVAAITVGDFIGVCVHAQGVGTGNFVIYHGDSQGSYLGYFVSGTYNGLGSAGGFSVSDVIRLEVVGGTYYPTRNGVADISPAANATYSSGRAGLAGYMQGSYGARATSLEVGNVGGPAAPVNNFWPFGAI